MRYKTKSVSAIITFCTFTTCRKKIRLSAQTSCICLCMQIQSLKKKEIAETAFTWHRHWSDEITHCPFCKAYQY